MTEPTISLVIASSDEGHLLGACLDSATGFDEVLVFDLECRDDTASIARERGADVIRLTRPPFIELIRSDQVSYASSDWILFVDPDERLPEGWTRAARLAIRDAPDVAAYWLGYREVAFDRELLHARYGAAKVALVRRDSVIPQPKEHLKPHAPLVIAGQVSPKTETIPLILHVGYRSVRDSIAKLGRYASHGGVGLGGDSVDLRATTAIKMLWSSVVMGEAYKDGSAGIAVASLSAIGDYLGLLQRWDESGRPNAHSSRLTQSGLTFARRLHDAQWAVRRSARIAVKRR